MHAHVPRPWRLALLWGLVVHTAFGDVQLFDQGVENRTPGGIDIDAAQLFDEGVPALTQYFAGIARVLRAGEPLQKYHVEALMGFFASVMGTGLSALAGLVCPECAMVSFAMQAVVLVLDAITKRGTTTVLDKMKYWVRLKLLQDNLASATNEFKRAVDHLQRNLEYEDTSDEERIEEYRCLEQYLEVHLKGSIFNEHCINEVLDGQKLSDLAADSCKQWRESGVHEAAYAFAALHVGVLVELARLQPRRSRSIVGDAGVRARDYAKLLQVQYAQYREYRLSFLIPPAYGANISFALYCRPWLRNSKVCQMFNGQDCFFASEPVTCKYSSIFGGQEHHVGSFGDECTVENLCDVIGTECHGPNRTEFPFGQYIRYGVPEDVWRQCQTCYDQYTRRIEQNLASFEQKIVGLDNFRH